MSFCNLPAGQIASLILIIGSMATSATPDTVKMLIESKDWHTLAILLAFSTRKDVVAPTQADLAAVGGMARGLRNAHFVLAIADANATADGRAYLQSALDTHCWDRVANTLVQSMTKTGLTFTGADLKEAYAPYDDSPCVMPGGSGQPLSGAIQSGQVIDGFFSKTLADSFEHEFGIFFTDTMPACFTAQFTDLCADIRNHLKDGLVEFGDAVLSAVESVRENFHLTPPG